MEIPSPLLLFGTILIMACLAGIYIGSIPSVSEEEKSERQGRRIVKNIVEFEYEGCEYLRYLEGRVGGVTHKGNCKNAIHKTGE